MHLIINPSDIYSLTGVCSHDSGEILMLLRKQDGIILCDPRTSALFDADKYEIIDDRKSWGKILSRYTTLDTDPDFLTQSLREKIEGYGVKLIMKKSPITQARIIKTSGEIGKLRESQRLNKLVYEKILPYLQTGVTEGDIARKIQILQLELGADGPSFPPIVAFGSNTAVPHHSPTEKKLQGDDIVLIDMGLVYKGYCSDMTRCLRIQSSECKVQNEGSFNEIYFLLQNVTREIVDWAKPGMKVAELDKKARKMLGKYEPYFTHSLGHGVGIDIHEAPGVSSKSSEKLEEGMVITIEPGIYIPGKYGARYEEMCLVDKTGLSVL